jgi:hypothetical protein
MQEKVFAVTDSLPILQKGGLLIQPNGSFDSDGNVCVTASFPTSQEHHQPLKFHPSHFSSYPNHDRQSCSKRNPCRYFAYSLLLASHAYLQVTMAGSQHWLRRLKIPT